MARRALLPGAQRPPGGKEGEEMARERVLVVEDEIIVAEELREDLERFGYDVPAVLSSGDEVVEAVARLRPDLLLMDIRIEGSVDGI